MAATEVDLMREALEHLPTGLMLLRAVRDVCGRITDFEWLQCNRAAARAIGLADVELRGSLVREELRDALRNEELERFVHVVETGESHSFELRGGADTLLRVTATRLGDGLSIAFVEQPVSRWRLLEDLFMPAPVAISIVRGPEHRYVLANPEYERMVERYGLVGKTIREAFPELPDDAPVLRLLDEVRRTREPFCAREYPVPLVRGGVIEDRYFHFICSPIVDATGVAALFTVAVDVSEQVRSRQRAEAVTRQLVLHERHYQATFDHAAVGIAQISPEGEWLRFNDRVAQMLGYTREQLEHLNFLDVVHPDDLTIINELGARLLCGEIPTYQLETRYRGRDGAAVWVNVSGSLVRDEAGEPSFFVAVIQDISERKAAADALLAADRQKDEFLAMLSHELRNPLAAIRSACALLDDIATPAPQMNRVQTILGRQTRHMAHLLDELLDLSRATKGKLMLIPRVIDLREVVREVLADLELPVAGPRLVAELGDEPVWIDGDDVRIAQVVHNLLGNAIKYTPSSGWIRLTLVHVDGQAVLTVTDTGVGIEPDLLDRLFEPFAQGPQDIARSSGGLGLGLALAKTIVELHGGSIHARSLGPNHGSTFEFRIPLTTAEHPMPSELNAPESHTARVMIVEDNEDAAELLAALLRARSFEVELASSGDQALTKIRAWRPDAVICDIGLPDIDGYTVARTIRADPQLAGVKLVALSGYGQVKDRMRAAEAGFDQHLTKPAAIDAVVRAIGSREA